MRLFPLILLVFLCQGIHAQILPNMAEMEHFDPYRPIHGRLEFFPDSLNPRSVREYDSTGRCVRHAQVRVNEGHWQLHGKDTVWDRYGASVYTVKANIPHGPFRWTFKNYLGENSVYYEYSGQYRNGRVHGKVKGLYGSYFHYENGTLHGSYMHRHMWPSIHEKGNFENGFRQGNVSIFNGDFKIKTLHYTDGYLQSVEFHLSEENAAYHDYHERKFLHFKVAADTLNNWVEIIKYGWSNDTLETQYHFQPFNIRKSRVYEYNDAFSWDYQYREFTKPETLRVEVFQPDQRHSTNFYLDGSHDDTAYRNNGFLSYCRDRKGNVYYFNDFGVLSSVSYSFEPYHNAVSCLFGLRNRWGNWVLPPEYEEISMSHQVGFIIKKDGLYGLCAWNGEVLIAPELEELNTHTTSRSRIPMETFQGIFHLFPAEIFIAQKKGKTGLIDSRGNWLIPAEYDGLHCRDSFATGYKGEDQFIWTEESGRYIRFKDTLEEIYAHYIPFQVKRKGKWGVLGRDMKWIIPPQYDHFETLTKRYIAGSFNSATKLDYWILDEAGQPIHQEALKARPVLRSGFIEIVGANNSRGIMTNSGKIIANAEYLQIERNVFKTRDQECLAPVYHVQKNDTHYLIDTNGIRSQSFDLLVPIVPYTEKVDFWGTYYADCPKGIAYVAKNDSHTQIINQWGKTLLDETTLGEAIDSIWVIGTIAFVNTPTRLLCYFSDNGRLFQQTPAKTAQLFYYSNLQLANYECIVRYQTHYYGLVDHSTGEWLLKPEYWSIEKRGEEYVLRDSKGKVSTYRRGEENSWKKAYSLCYPVNTENYIVYTVSGKAGLCYADGKLLIDTLYRLLAYQSSYNRLWYWAEKAENLWDIYGWNGERIYQDMPAISGSMLDDGAVLITQPDGKEVLLGSNREVLIKADRILLKDNTMQEYVYREGKLWGRYSVNGEISHPALYEKIWPYRPYYVMHNGLPGQLDSAGNLVASLDTFSFLNTPLPIPGHNYFGFRGSNNFENLYAQNFSLDSLKLWQSNLLFMLSCEGMDINKYSFQEPKGLGLTRVTASGELKRHDPSVRFLHWRDEGQRYYNQGFVSFFSDQLLSLFILSSNLNSTTFMRVESSTWFYKDTILQQLQVADIIMDESIMETLLLKGLAEKNLPVEVCPDLNLVYALNKDRFFMDEGGITFLIEVSHQEVYLPVKIPFSDMMDILKKDGPVYEMLVGG